MQRDFLLSRAVRYRRQLFGISLSTVGGSLVALAIPWLAGQLLGGVLGGMLADLRLLVGLLLAALVATTVMGILSQNLSLATSGRILADLRVETYGHLHRLPMTFHDGARKGDLLAVTTWQVESLSIFLTTTLARTPAMLVTVAGSVALMFALDPYFALVVPVLIPLFLIALKLASRSMRGLSKRARDAESMVVAVAESDLEMLPAIRAFAMEDEQQAAYATLVEQARDLAYKSERNVSALGPLVGMVTAIAAILFIVIAGQQVMAGQKTPAQLFSFLLYAALLTRPVGALADIYGRYQIAKGTLSRLEAVMSQPAEPGHHAPSSSLRITGAVGFHGVTFAYPGRPTVLNSADLAIAPGEIVAITGDNGAGKSTLVNLLLRFYEPGAGTITLDGTDIATLPVQYVRRQIGYVPQRAMLFNGTVRENILFGLTGANEEQLARAITLSQSAEFIAALPRGLDTQIGDNGVRLSGGQRQRLALARAVLRDPPVLIFDEATSMYDLESEAAFVEACTTALSGRTVILITHRPASLALADRIVCVKDGSVQPAAPSPAGN